LSGVNAAGAVFDHSAFSGVSFAPGLNLATQAPEENTPIASQLSGATFRDAYGREPNFNGSCLAGAIFNNAIFDGSNFSETDLSGARFQHVDLRKPVFSDGNLLNISFTPDPPNDPKKHANIEGGDFSRSDLRESHFAFADLSSVKFSQADLTKADFSNAILRNVDFSGADLTDAKFESAVLESVTFENSRLERTSFLGAHTTLSFDSLRSCQIILPNGSTTLGNCGPKSPLPTPKAEASRPCPK